MDVKKGNTWLSPKSCYLDQGKAKVLHWDVAPNSEPATRENQTIYVSELSSLNTASENKYNLSSTCDVLGIMQGTRQAFSLLLLHLSEAICSSCRGAVTHVASDPHTNPVGKDFWVLLAPFASGEDPHPQRN